MRRGFAAPGPGHRAASGGATLAALGFRAAPNPQPGRPPCLYPLLPPATPPPRHLATVPNHPSPVQPSCVQNRQLVTAKSSEVNLTVVPDPETDRDAVEHAVPEQFISSFQGGRLVTVAASHGGG